MDRHWIRLNLTALLIMTIMTSAALADRQAGSISGTVVDQDTIPLPGVTVTVSGPFLQGERMTLTDREGRYRFPLMPVGRGYSVTSVLDGYQRVILTDIDVTIAANTRVDFTLVESSGELGEVTVSGEAPLLDAKKTSISETITAKFMEDIPRNRLYFDATWIVPGVAGYGNVHAHGADNTDNVFLVDGVDTTDNATGTFGMMLSDEVVQEVEMKTGAFEAEYGRATGAISNVVTKSGGNAFHGAVPIYYTNFELKQQQDEDRRNFEEMAFYEVDPGASLGGPVLRDKLWFFASFNRMATRYEGMNVFDEPVKWNSIRDETFVKLTGQINPDNKIIAQYATEPTISESVGSLSSYYMSSAYGEYESGGDLSKLQWTSIFTPNLFLETKIAYHRLNIFYRPSNADYDDPMIYDLLDGEGAVISGNVFQIYETQRPRVQYHAVFNYFVPEWGGSHDMKFGVEYQDFEFEEHSIFPDWYFINQGTDRTGEELPDQWYRQTRRDTINDGSIATAFVQDAWTINENWTFNLGVRWETQKQNNDVGEQVYNLNNLVAPRAGVSWDVRGDGRSKLYLNYGKSYDALGTYLGWFLNRHTNESWYYEGDFETDKWEEITHTTPEDNATQVDPDLKPSFKEEIILGYEAEFALDRSFAVRGIYNWQDNLVEDIIGNEEMIRSGEEESVWYYVTNVPEARRKYRGVEFSVKKRLSDNYQYLLAYTFSKAKGSVANQGQAEGMSVFADFAEMYHNRYGYLPWDDRHYVKLNGAYHLPWGIIAGVSFLWRSGRPYNRVGNIALYVSDTNAFNNYFFSYFVDPRGSHRMGHVWTLDLRLTKDFNIGDTELSVFLDAFNVTNNQFVLSRQEWDNNNWGNAEIWMQAGTFVAGAKYSF